MNNSRNAATPAFLSGGGEVGALLRAHDWSISPLGHPSTWPQSLRTVVTLLLNSKFPMFVAWGPELVFLYNDSYIEILGEKHPASLGKRFIDIWPEIWDDIFPLVERALAGESSYCENLPLLLHRHGYDEQTWLTFSLSPLHDESDNVVGMYCACVETTAQMLAEKYRKEENNRFRTLFAQAPSFMAILRGPEHVFDLANNSYLHLVGNRQIRGKPLHEALPEVAEQVLELLDQVYTSGEAYVGRAKPIELQREPHMPMEQRFLDLVYQPILDEHGLVTGIFIEGNDVTERKEAEAALIAAHAALEDRVAERTRELRETSQLLAAMFDRAPGGIAITDLEGRFIKANAAYLGLVGYSEQELLAMSMQSLAVGADYQRKHELLQQLRDGSRSFFEIEMRYQRRDGEVVWVSNFVSTIDDEQNRPRYFVKVVQDIGARKRAESEILASQEELRALYDRLQTVREEERLALAREVHDQLGQILSAVKIDIKLLEDRIRPQEARLSRRRILAELDSASRALEQAINMVRQIASSLRVQDVSEQGLHAAIEWHARDFERRTKIKYRIRFPPGLDKLGGPVGTVLFRIFTEAMTNVARHAKASRVEISLVRRGGAVLLRVCDDGTGISRKHARSVHSIGLAGIRERAALAGGRAVIGPLRPCGTLVAARIPLLGDNDAGAEQFPPELKKGS